MQWSRNIKNIGGGGGAPIFLLTSNTYCLLDCMYLTQMSNWVIIGWARAPPVPNLTKCVELVL